MAMPAAPAKTDSTSTIAVPNPIPTLPGNMAPMPGPTSTPPDGMAAMGKMMEGMMSGAGQGCCDGGARTEIYPLLMSLPAFTPELRAQVQRLASERTDEGKALMQVGQERLTAATAAGDHNVAAAAILQLRDGLGRIGSGVAVHKMLQEATPPRVVATRWFKSEMNLGTSGRVEAGPAHGVAPIHLIIMAFLVAFAIAMVAMYFFKMRRTAALFGRIEGSAGKPPPGSAPMLAGPPNPPSPNTPPPNPPPSNPPSPNSPPPVSPAPGETSKTGLTVSATPTAQKPGTFAPGAPEGLLDLAPPSAPSGPVAFAVPNKLPPSLPDAKWRGSLRVTKIITETPSVKTLRLGPTAGETTLPFIFLPGQFLNVAFSIGGARMNRSYSISSSPLQREYLDLTVKREPRGAVSRHIDDLLRVGDELEAGGPVGRFAFNGTEADSIVLISGGVGITPMMSISRYLTQMAWPNEIFFVYACRSPVDFIFANELAALEHANPHLQVTVVMEHPDGTDWQGPTGRLSKDLLAQTVPDITSRRIHICGPPVMMDAVRALLAELKVPSEQVKTEDFGTAAPAPGAGGAARFATPATGPLVIFSKNNKSAKIHVDQTLLELSEELNIGIEFSCRVGTCGICKVKLTEGEVDMAIDDALDADDNAKGLVLACQAKPKTPVTVEA